MTFRGAEVPRLWRVRRAWRVRCGASVYYGRLGGALRYWRGARREALRRRPDFAAYLADRARGETQRLYEMQRRHEARWAELAAWHANRARYYAAGGAEPGGRA